MLRLYFNPVFNATGAAGAPGHGPVQPKFDAPLLPSLDKGDLSWKNPCPAITVATWPLAIQKPDAQTSQAMSVEHLAIPGREVSPGFAHTSTHQELPWKPEGAGLFDAMETKDHASFVSPLLV